MKPGKALHFLNQDPLWLIRALGILTAVIIPPYRFAFPAEAIDPMWIRFLISGAMIILVATTFFWEGIRKYANQIIYTATTLMSGWMLGLALINNLSPDYTSSYFILVFTSLILYRNWTWLGGFMLINLVTALVFISQMDAPLFNPMTFIAMQLSIFVITILGLMKGFREFEAITGREDLLRNINEASFENAKTAILVTDGEGIVLHLNQLWLEMWPLDDPLGESQTSGMWMVRCQRLLSNPQTMIDISRLTGKGKDQTLIEELHLTDGRVIEMQSRTFKISEKSNGRIWFFDDITAVFKNADMLRASRQRLLNQNDALVKLASSDKDAFKDLEECFANITKTVAETLNTNRASIWRFAPESASLECQSVFFADDAHCPAELDISKAKSPAYFKLLETERVVFIDDFDKNELTSPFSLPAQKGRTARSRLIIPLRSNGELFGILSAERIGSSSEWPTEEQQFLASVGDLTMVAVEADERKKAEASRQELNALIETVFELAGVGILVTGADRKVLNVNKHYLSIWGLEADHVYNGDPDEVIAFCRAQVFDESELSESMRFLLDNPNENDAKSLFFKDGRIVERYTEVLRIKDDVIGRVWFYRDVTTRLQSETKLIESEMQNKAILDAIPDLILRINLSGQILDAKIPENSPFERLENVDKDQNIDQVFPSDFNAVLIEKAKLALARAMLFEVEIETQLLSEIGDYDLRIIQSGIDEVLVMIRDVTERKKTEKELVQRNHELDSFVYRASHDLKAPLNSLMGLIDILKAESLDKSLLMYVGLMDKSVIKLDTFIRNLSDFSRIARIEIQAKPVDFSQLIEEATESLFFMENAANIEKIVEITPGPAFIGDSFHIGIVLSNLISNAIKYTDSKKPKPFVKVTVATTEKDCTFTVEDNGLGIPETYQARIFDLFFRASTQSFGSGLGLYITRNAIDKMEGEIEISSKEGQGTSFKVILPNVPKQIESPNVALEEKL